MTGPTRRSVLTMAGAASLAAGACVRKTDNDAWDSGDVRHILPTASDTEFLIKVSFQSSIDAASLQVSDRTIPGERTDTEGRYWRFRARDLFPGRSYQLQLFAGRRALCDPWPLTTMPARDSLPERLRILSYTCAGGPEDAKSVGGVEAFRPLAIRQKLIDRGLSFDPDIVIANGDHIYWDQRAWLEHPHPEIRRLTKEIYDEFGHFNRNQLIFGTANEFLIKRIGEQQIAELYGTRLRSTPAYFVNDDHDYFENDDAFEEYVAFPPDAFQVRAARAIQRLFYPEFLPEPTRSTAIAGASAPDNGPGVSECFGTIRAGRLFEAVLFDCGRFLTLKGPAAGLIPPDAEAWVMARTKAEETLHFMHVPSHPMGWTAGKWREWYPDVVARHGADGVVVSTHDGAKGGVLTTDVEKFLWQEGWFLQHQRLAQGLSGQEKRIAITLSGDLHAIGHGSIMRSGDLDLSNNPIHSILSGPVSTSAAGWPTFARGAAPAAPQGMVLEQEAPPVERNGFTLLDVEPEKITVTQFSWREPEPINAPEDIKPTSSFEISRRI